MLANLVPAGCPVFYVHRNTNVNLCTIHLPRTFHVSSLHFLSFLSVSNTKNTNKLDLLSCFDDLSIFCEYDARYSVRNRQMVFCHFYSSKRFVQLCAERGKSNRTIFTEEKTRYLKSNSRRRVYFTHSCLTSADKKPTAMSRRTPHSTGVHTLLDERQP